MKNLEKSWNFITRIFPGLEKFWKKWINPERFGKVMEIYFYKSLYNTIMFIRVLNFGTGFAHGLYRIFLLFPAAFDFKMMDIHTFIQ